MTSPTPEDGELFAGPGGWDVAARLLGIHPRGLEWDASAIATAHAAGFIRLLDAEGKGLDVAKADPQSFFNAMIRLLIASPPCQAFSAAGKGKGRAGAPYILMGVQLIAWGNDPAAVCTWVDEMLDDTRAALVLEPLRWVKELNPEYIALEQVPPVLPLWQAMADVLRGWGYSVWCGNLHAEQYDLPQTRKRAILIASRIREVSEPPPVRRKHRKDRATGKTNRYVDFKLDTPGLKPWISMADALHRGLTERPSYTVCAGGAETGGAEPFGNGARQQMLSAQERGDWQLRMNSAPHAAVRSLEEPSSTVFFGERLNRAEWQQRRNSGPGAARDPRELDDPSYTIRANGSGSHPSGVEWQQRSNYNGPATADGERERLRRGLDEPSSPVTSKPWHWEQMGDTKSSNGTIRKTEEPAATITASMDNGNTNWTRDRPSTTVNGDPRIPEPGHKHRGPDCCKTSRDAGGIRQSMFSGEAIRVTVQEAAVLQGFPADYPWQGGKGAQHRQVGDAMPPPLAWHVLRALFGLPVQHYPGTEDL